MRYAIIENNTVVNVVEADTQLDPAWIECAHEVSIGWTYVGVEFIAPPVLVPPVHVAVPKMTTTEVSALNYKKSVQRQAEVLASSGKHAEALYLLKTLEMQ